MRNKSVIAELWVWIWAESIMAKLGPGVGFSGTKIGAWIASFTLNKTVGLSGLINEPEKLIKL